MTRGDNLIVAIGAALSRRFANALFEYNRIVTLRNLRRALRHMNHPAADADDAEIMGVLAVMGYAIIHCGTFDMTVEQFRTAARDWRNRPPPLPVVTDREHL